MRAINEMLLQAPNNGAFIELFPFFPANETVCNQPSNQIRFGICSERDNRNSIAQSVSGAQLEYSEWELQQ